MKPMMMMNNKKKILSLTKETNSEKETYALKKRTEKEEVTKTLEKISNGWLLTVDKYSLDGGDEYSCIKKYFEKNPLEMEEEEDKEEEEVEKMAGEGFMENWDVLSL
jgi:hypothetical protein